MTRRRTLSLPLSAADGADLLRREMFMAKRLKDHGCDVFAGSSDMASRKALFRRVITERGLDHAILAKGSDGKCVTYAQAFERTYGEPLSPKRKGKPPIEQPAAQDEISPAIANPQENLL